MVWPHLPNLRSCRQDVGNPGGDRDRHNAFPYEVMVSICSSTGGCGLSPFKENGGGVVFVLIPSTTCLPPMGCDVTWQKSVLKMR